MGCKAAGAIFNSQFHHFKDGLQSMYDTVKPYTEKLDNALDFASEACDDPSKLGDGVTQWIGSVDPVLLKLILIFSHFRITKMSCAM